MKPCQQGFLYPLLLFLLSFLIAIHCPDTIFKGFFCRTTFLTDYHKCVSNIPFQPIFFSWSLVAVSISFLLLSTMSRRKQNSWVKLFHLFTFLSSSWICMLETKNLVIFVLTHPAPYKLLRKIAGSRNRYIS